MRARVCVRCEYVCVVCRTGDREWVCKGHGCKVWSNVGSVGGVYMYLYVCSVYACVCVVYTCVWGVYSVCVEVKE